MNRKEVHDCFNMNAPDTDLKIKQHRKPVVEFTIHPLGKVGIKYQYLVECNIPIKWDKLQSVLKQTVLQELSLEERLRDALEK